MSSNGPDPSEYLRMTVMRNNIGTNARVEISRIIELFISSPQTSPLSTRERGQNLVLALQPLSLLAFHNPAYRGQQFLGYRAVGPFFVGDFSAARQFDVELLGQGFCRDGIQGG